MTPQEREVISGIFERLKQAETQTRDPEAERFIADMIGKQPYAPYVLAQSVYVQEQALTGLNQQVEQLQAQVRQLQQAQQTQQQQGGGFLSGLFGGGAAARPQPQAAPQGGPWGGQPQQGGMAMQAPQAQQGGPWGGQQQPAPRAGSGFLGTALTTAAGVAGGMVVGSMLMNAFSGHGGGAHAAGTSGSGIEPMGQGTAALPSADTSQAAQPSGYERDDADDYAGGSDFGGGDSYDA